MKIVLSTLFSIISWLTVLIQYNLMIENRLASIFETTIRFFSFFTILTNLLVAIYFTLSFFKKNNRLRSIIHRAGTLTAVTVYISIVGVVYQVVLRPIWEPKGIQMIVDELLHSIIPILVIIYWYLYEDKISVTFRQIPKWLIYPLVYLGYILIRGAFSDFYPYPFVDVASIGIEKVLTNSAVLMVLFMGVSAVYIKIGKVISNK